MRIRKSIWLVRCRLLEQPKVEAEERTPKIAKICALPGEVESDLCPRPDGADGQVEIDSLAGKETRSIGLVSSRSRG